MTIILCPFVFVQKIRFEKLTVKAIFVDLCSRIKTVYRFQNRPPDRFSLPNDLLIPRATVRSYYFLWLSGSLIIYLCLFRIFRGLFFFIFVRCRVQTFLTCFFLNVSFLFFFQSNFIGIFKQVCKLRELCPSQFRFSPWKEHFYMLDVYITYHTYQIGLLFWIVVCILFSVSFFGSRDEHLNANKTWYYFLFA